MKPRRKRLEQVELGDELIVVDSSGQRVHRLNSTARAIWRLCDGEKDVAGIVAGLANEFGGASTQTLRREVEEAVIQMRRVGILEGRRPNAES
jgi:hypothetical protein